MYEEESEFNSNNTEISKEINKETVQSQHFHTTAQLTSPEAKSIPTYGVRAQQDNSPPYFIKQLQNLELGEDFGIYILNLSDHAYDNEDQPEALGYFITGENKSIINITNENSTDQHLIITSIDDAYGETTVRVWVRDTTGQSVFREMTINIKPDDDLPILLESELPELKVRYGKQYSINLQPYIVDPDTDISEITIKVLPEDQEYASIQNKNLILDFKSKNDLKKNYINLKIFDCSDPIRFSLTNIRVNLTDNYPPELLKSIPEIILYKDNSLNRILDLDYYFSDLDHDIELLGYQYFQASHLTININGDNTVDINSVGTWHGSEQIIIRCFDPTGAFKEELLTIKVTSNPSLFSFSEIPDIAIHYENEFLFELQPYIYSNDSSSLLNFEIFEFIDNRWVVSSEFSNIIFDYDTYPILKINYSKEYLNRTTPVFISISDSYDTITKFQEFLIKITDNYPPILKKKIANCEFDEDFKSYPKLDLHEYFYDSENGALEFSNLSENVIIDINQNGLVDVSSKLDWFGTELVTIRAFDLDGAMVETSFNVKINPINDPPKILPIPQINVTEGIKESFEYLKYLLDVDNNISELNIDAFELTGNYITIAGGFLILDYPSKLSRDQEFTLIVSDGKNTTSQIVKVLIKPRGNAEKEEGLRISPLMFWGSIIVLVVLMLLLAIMGIVYIRRLRSFKFNEIYLIYKDGLLIAHATTKKKTTHDSDIIGSMFTAIQDFIHDSFSDSSSSTETSTLKRLDFGDFQIVIDRGEHIYIAAVYSGFAIRKMVLKIGKLRRKIEKKYADFLPTWNGDMQQLKGTEDMIQELLYSTVSTREFTKPKKPGSKRSKESEIDLEINKLKVNKIKNEENVEEKSKRGNKSGSNKLDEN